MSEDIIGYFRIKVGHTGPTELIRVPLFMGSWCLHGEYLVDY